MVTPEMEKILFDGTLDEISKVKCAECGGDLEYSYSGETFSIWCEKCCCLERYSKSPFPNCIKYKTNREV